MEALVYYGKEDVRLEQIPKPCIQKKHDVLIKVHYAGVCGSEIARIIGDMAIPLEHPVPHGHEFSGVVEAVGTAVTHVKQGDRVAVAPKTVCGTCEDCLNNRVGQCANTRGFIGVKLAGGWAEYCVVDEINAVKLPEGVTTFEGAFLEPLTVAIHGIMVGNYLAGKTVAVVGCGTIGALTLQAARWFGAAKLTAFDIDADRLVLAEKMGAEHAVNTGGNWQTKAGAITDGRMFDYVFETGGVPFTEKASIILVGAQGTLVYIGTPFSEIRFSPQEFEQINRKELWIRGAWQSYSTPFPGREWETGTEMMAKSQVSLEGLVDRIISPEALFSALEDARAKRLHGKIMLRMSADADRPPVQI